MAAIVAGADEQIGVTRHARDLAIVLVLSVVAAGASWQGSAIAGASRDADLERRLFDQKVIHDRTLQHPLAILLMRAPVSMSRHMWPEVVALDVLRAGLALAATAWSALLFAILRLTGCRTADAVVFALIAMASAASTLWFSVPATESLASLSMLPALAMIAATARFRVPEWVSSLAVASSFAIDVGNGLAGSVAAWFAHPRPRAAQVIANGLAVVFALVGLQHYLFPTSGSLSAATLGFAPASAVSAVNTLVLRAMVIPDGVTGLIGTLAWTLLLAIGVTAEGAVRVRRYALLALSTQLLLCVATGAEAFGASLSAIPWLIVIASLGTLRPASRPVVLGLAVLLLVSAVVSNGRHFARSFSAAESMADVPR